jgi:hypothetical protein
MRIEWTFLELLLWDQLVLLTMMGSSSLTFTSLHNIQMYHQ